MKIAFVINEIPTEKTNYATTHLALTALISGHDVWYIEIGSFAYDPDELVHAWAHRPARSNYRTAKRFLADLKGGKSVRERITVDSLDILFLRNNPADDFMTRPWARLAGINSPKAARILKREGFTNVSILKGGMMNWYRRGLTVEGAEK